MREELRAIDPNLAVSNVMWLDDILANTRFFNRVAALLLGMFGSIALLISVVGLYAVTAYAIGQRTREIGVRVALGARVDQVIWLFVRRALLPLTTGVGFGLAAVFSFAGVMRSVLVETSPTAPVVLLPVTLLLAAVAVLACLVPARRAARLDVVSALRQS